MTGLQNKVKAHYEWDGERPLIADLFCGAGGAAWGYWLAGFYPIGVDNRPQPNYPFKFHQADAMTLPSLLPVLALGELPMTADARSVGRESGDSGHDNG